mmetsp:Transcript_125903/g.402410  ORF Transcript_125903/g.402410 Transcript_125903/m.402410 type:complete len:84 (+) Transcript_125903:214-465(+)
MGLRLPWLTGLRPPWLLGRPSDTTDDDIDRPSEKDTSFRMSPENEPCRFISPPDASGRARSEDMPPRCIAMDFLRAAPLIDAM